MRFSPTFDDVVVTTSVRPSIPLESGGLDPNAKPTLVYQAHPHLENLGQTTQAPGEPVVKAPTPVVIQDKVEVSSFFDTSAHPTPSRPTLSIPKVKVKLPEKAGELHMEQKIIPEVKPEAIPQLPVAAKKIETVKVVETPKIETPKLEIKQNREEPMIEPVRLEAPPKPRIEATKPKTQPIFPAPKPVALKPKVETPIFENSPIRMNVVPSSPAIKEEQIKELAEDQVANKVASSLEKIEHSIKESDDLQKSIASELQKIAPHVTPKPIITAPAIATEPPHFQEPDFPTASSPAPAHPAVKTASLSPAQEREQPMFTTVHFWDYFLIRVNPKLNPYKSANRARIILGIKAVGLILFAVGLFIIGANFTTFSINILFEAISTFTISGILLFLGENLNLFFEPINPYKIREVV